MAVKPVFYYAGPIPWTKFPSWKPVNPGTPVPPADLVARSFLPGLRGASGPVPLGARVFLPALGTSQKTSPEGLSFSSGSEILIDHRREDPLREGEMIPFPSPIGVLSIRSQFPTSGEGVCYLAVNEAGQKVVLKIVRIPNSTNMEAFDRKLSSLLFSLNGVLDTDFRTFPVNYLNLAIVSHYVPGRNLATEIMERNRVFSEAEVVDCLVQVLENYVARLHEKGLVHQDIKPRNIIKTPEGKCVLIDFGLARETGADLTMTRTMRGTLGYSNPTLFNQPAGDLYSMARTAYFLLTGKDPPYVDERFQGADKALLEQLPVSKPLLRILMKMQQYYEEKYENCAEVLYDLKALPRGQSPVALAPAFPDLLPVPTGASGTLPVAVISEGETLDIVEITDWSAASGEKIQKMGELKNLLEGVREKIRCVLELGGTSRDVKRNIELRAYLEEVPEQGRFLVEYAIQQLSTGRLENSEILDALNDHIRARVDVIRIFGHTLKELNDLSDRMLLAGLINFPRNPSDDILFDRIAGEEKPESIKIFRQIIEKFHEANLPSIEVKTVFKYLRGSTIRIVRIEEPTDTPGIIRRLQEELGETVDEASDLPHGDVYVALEAFMQERGFFRSGEGKRWYDLHNCEGHSSKGRIAMYGGGIYLGALVGFMPGALVGINYGAEAFAGFVVGTTILGGIMKVYRRSHPLNKMDIILNYSFSDVLSPLVQLLETLSPEAIRSLPKVLKVVEQKAHSPQELLEKAQTHLAGLLGEGEREKK